MPTANNDSRLLAFYLTAMHDLSRALQASPRRRAGASSQAMREALYRVLGTLTIGRGALLVVNDEGTRLETLVVKGARGLKGLAAEIEQGPRGRRRASIASRPFRLGLPPGDLEPIVAALRPALERALLTWIAPLTTGDGLAGLLVFGERIDGRPPTSLELMVLEEMAGLLALRVDEARMRRRLEHEAARMETTQRQLRKIFLEAIRALAGAIDAPEPGGGPTHSARVASLAEAIARRLGLPAAARERLYVAGLLHDIGKQVIDRQVLEKAGSLTEEERQEVSRHPAIAADLISHVRFPWGDVAEIVRHHHERPDGSGYPDRLAGDQVSLEARVLMMAEAFDAMTSDQPWRPRLSLPRIVEQISHNLGVQFEPRVTAALCDAVQDGLDATGDPPEFAESLEAAFDPALIRKALGELRRLLAHPSDRPDAHVSVRVIPVISAAGE
jgi:putative nucleotidyltransferase with HDIG domain